MTNKYLACTFLSIALLTSCAKSPTGRHQIKLYSSQQLATMGNQAFDNMKSSPESVPNRTDNQYVNCVASFITQQVPKSTFDGTWEVVVFEDDQINAFALPGGKIGVYRGLLNVAENQHQLAALIGHEVGHVIAEHGNERMSGDALINVGMQLSNQLMKTNKVAYNREIMAAIGLGVQVGVKLPFSRTHETEADVIGLDLMARSGFDPAQSITLWQNMQQVETSQRPAEFMSTHPNPNSRIKVLTQHLPQARRAREKSQSHPDCRG